MTHLGTPRARLESLLNSARSLADARTERGLSARSRLAASSGLSAAGVDFAIARCLEIAPDEGEIEALIRSTPTAQVAHVLLSANVFVAAHRAIAIGLAASETVQVRPSRREPEMAELLLAGAPGLFRIVSELAPRAGDRLWAYGSDETLGEVATTLPPGVAFHGHGSGFGVGVIDASVGDSELSEIVPRLAEDIVLFDQRGCLSPRALLVQADVSAARDIARALAKELARLEAEVPRGSLEPAEAAAITHYRDTASFTGDVYAAGLGFVSAASDDQWLLPPSGRNLHVVPTSDALSRLSMVRPMITSCAFAGQAALKTALRRALPGARHCPFGNMQRPPFDGPVDRRDL